MPVKQSQENLTKKERLTLSRDKDKMEKVLGGIAQLGRLPAALFIVDIGHEHIALADYEVTQCVVPVSTSISIKRVLVCWIQ